MHPMMGLAPVANFVDQTVVSLNSTVGNTIICCIPLNANHYYDPFFYNETGVHDKAYTLHGRKFGIVSLTNCLLDYPIQC